MGVFVASVFSCTGYHFYISCEESVLYLILSMCTSQIEQGWSTSRATRLWEKSLVQTQVSLLTQNTPAEVTGSVLPAKCAFYSFSHLITYCISPVGVHSFTLLGWQRGFMKIFRSASPTTACLMTCLLPPVLHTPSAPASWLVLGHGSCSCSGCLTTADMWSGMQQTLSCREDSQSRRLMPLTPDWLALALNFCLALIHDKYLFNVN